MRIGNHEQQQQLTINYFAEMEPGDWVEGSTPSIFVFNPFAEGYIAQGKAFTPVKHQGALANDLANLPQFLCEPGDIVLVPERPSQDFLNALQRAGFAAPEFVELRQGRIESAPSLFRRKFKSLRPWAWGPDSVELLEPLFARVIGDTANASRYFSENIARLYSKAWSADFLRKVLAQLGQYGDATAYPWLCSEREAGVAVDTVEDALGVVAAIRKSGHHRVVVKEALGLAGHNAIRLWEPEILPTQRQWLSHALSKGGHLVVEPWLERELDFSVQLEMSQRKLELRGYTGLVNDLKGQFLANWAEADYPRRLPAKVSDLLGSAPDISQGLLRLYDEIFSLLETELQRLGFVGPISIDALVYRTPHGDCRIKPVVEINPRYTMGRLTVELMKHVCPGSCGLFRLITRTHAHAEGFADLSAWAAALRARVPARLDGEPEPKIRECAFCLNDPDRARVCLAVFEANRMLNVPVPGYVTSFHRD
jgi:hypothetical protein